MSAVPSDGRPSLDFMLASPGSSSTVLRLAIGARLRILRDAAGIAPQDAAAYIRCDKSKISRMECGKSPLKERDVVDLLALYGAPALEQAAAQELVALSNEPGWWERYSKFVPDWFDKLLGLQEGASMIWTYEVLLVPGLLQTRDYAWAVTLSGFPLADRLDIEARVELRMRRQQILTREGGPELWAIVDPSVLDRPIGSDEVMRGQIEHLIQAAQQPRITLQFAPKDFVLVGTPVTLMRFGIDLPDVVYVENPLGAHYFDRPKETSHFRALLDPLSSSAFGPEETLQMLETALDRYR
ncbi:helix-turn-helix transcriptional regulator [Streptomyces katrae]|uniref:Helix-turn-helix transcriptional regulator n=1 Tax=Streptomyces katrae TaxID=68223 RepID=A0ABT7GVX6_9ACTN|nr:helix-turn-helix transcriptional regulator [Streptomyces katrae]MDK9497044.1 helix-turn-helix transcriptional regulator [Streptomyces katrae]